MITPNTTPLARIEVLTTREAERALAHLSRFHYRAGNPAPTCHALGVFDERGDAIGILTVGHPTLNAPWLTAAWPHAFTPAMTKRDRAHALNALVRTITRVIIDPRHRGLGLSTALVRTYLQRPLTPFTHSAASMGRFFPFFERAGMRAVPSPLSRRDRRLRAALARINTPFLHLVDRAYAHRALTRDPRLRDAIRAWAMDSKATRRHVTTDPARLADLAILAASACSTPTPDAKAVGEAHAPHQQGLVIYAAP